MSLGYAIAHALAAAAAGAADARNKTNFVEQIGRSHQEAAKLAAGDRKKRDEAGRIWDALSPANQKQIGSREDAIALGPAGLSQVLGANQAAETAARAGRAEARTMEEAAREQATRDAETATVLGQAQEDANLLSHLTSNGERSLGDLSPEELVARKAQYDEHQLDTSNAVRGAQTAGEAGIARIRAVTDPALLYGLRAGDPLALNKVLDFSGIPNAHLIPMAVKRQIQADIAQAVVSRMTSLTSEQVQRQWASGDGAARREALETASGLEGDTLVKSVAEQASKLAAALPMDESLGGGLESIQPYLNQTEEGRLILAALGDFDPGAPPQLQGEAFLNILGRVDPSRVKALVEEAKASQLTISQAELILPLLTSAGIGENSDAFTMLSGAIQSKNAEGANQAYRLLASPGSGFEAPLAEKIIGELELGANLDQFDALDRGLASLRSLKQLRDYLGDEHALTPQIDGAFETVRNQFDGDFFAEAWSKQQRRDMKEEIGQMEDLLTTLARSPSGDTRGFQIWTKGPSGEWSKVPQEASSVWFATGNAMNTRTYDITHDRVVDSYKVALQRDLAVSRALMDAGVGDESDQLKQEMKEDRHLLENLQKGGSDSRFEQAYTASRALMGALGQVTINYPVYRPENPPSASSLAEARQELGKALRLVTEDDMGGEKVDQVVERLITDAWLYKNPAERLSLLRSAISTHVPELLRAQMGGETLSETEQDFALDVWEEASRNFYDVMIGPSRVGIDPENWEFLWERPDTSGQETEFVLFQGEQPASATVQSGGWFSWFRPDELGSPENIDDTAAIMLFLSGQRQAGVDYEVRQEN